MKNRKGLQTGFVGKTTEGLPIMTRDELIKRFTDPVIERHYGGINVEIYFDEESVKLGGYWAVIQDGRTGREATEIDGVYAIKAEEVNEVWNHAIPFAFRADKVRAQVADAIEKAANTEPVLASTAK